MIDGVGASGIHFSKFSWIILTLAAWTGVSVPGNGGVTIRATGFMSDPNISPSLVNGYSPDVHVGPPVLQSINDFGLEYRV